MKKLKFIWLFLFLLLGSNAVLAQDTDCLSFDGSNDYVKAGNAALNSIGTDDFTFEAWINADLVGQNAHPTIFSNRTVSGNGVMFFFHNNWGGSAYKMLCLQIGAVNYFVFDNGTFDATFFDGTCHHVAISREGSLITFYADGVSFGTRSIGVGDPTAGSVGDLWIGQDLPTNNSFNGNISQVRIWDVVRTEDEIFDNKDITIAGATPNLLGYWELNEGTGQVAADKTETADGQLGSTDSPDAFDPTWGADCCIDGCDVLTTEVSSTDICIGEEVTLEATSENGGTITWDGGVVDGVPFVPGGPGVYTYTATSDFENDCDFTVEVTVHDLPDINAVAYPTEICLGETVLFGGTGGVSYEWDMGVENGVPYEPLTTGTLTFTITGTDEFGCQNTDEIDILVGAPPTVDFEFIVDGISSEDGSTGGCILNPVQFNDLTVIIDPDVIVEWDWDFGDGDDSDEENPSHTYDDPGTYTVTLTVETESGCTASYSMEIIMTEGLSIEILSNEPSCYGFSDGSITINVVGGLEGLIFEISNDLGDLLNEDNSNTANTLSSGWYYFSVSDGSACDAEDSLFLDQPGELDIAITVTDPLCFGFKTGWARVDSVYNSTGDYDAISYIWNPNPSGVGGTGADSAYSMGAGNYTLTINDANGCSKVFDFEVEQPDSLYFSEFGFEHAYCRLHEYQNGNGVVFGAAAGGTPDYDYVWKNLETGATLINTTWGGRNPGTYEFTVVDANGCILKRTVFLDSLNPIADFTVTSAQLNGDLKGSAPVEAIFTNTSENFANPNNPTADTTFFWNLDRPIAEWQVTHDYFEIFDTTYIAKGQTYLVDVCLVAINKNGCTDTACKIITIYEPILFTPINVFTPNGDGINDFFTFDFKSASISDFTCQIVNRWGVVVFEMEDISDVWDGTDKRGNPCEDGTYFYTYIAVSNNGTELKGQGTVNLVDGQ